MNAPISDTRSLRPWGLETEWRHLARFAAFAALHTLNFIANVSAFSFLYSSLYAAEMDQPHFQEPLKVAYVAVLGGTLLLVGVYCTRLAWSDKYIDNNCTTICGALQKLFISIFLGFTQLIQLKVAWAKYIRRTASVQPDDENEGPAGQESPIPGFDGYETDSSTYDSLQTRVADSQAQVDAALEDAIPWAFPSKCLEGVFEASAFAGVLLYITLKTGWTTDTVLTKWELQNGFSFTMVASGLLSFFTVSLSLLNFDYHLSQSVKNTVDHSLLYTFLHAVFRGCEAGSRLVTFVLLILAFRTCDDSARLVYRLFPWVVLAGDYIWSVFLLLYLSVPAERRFNYNCLVSVPSAAVLGFVMIVANLAEFVEIGDLTGVRFAAARFSRFVRVFRFFQLLALLIIISFNQGCPITVLVDGQPQQFSILRYLFYEHKGILFPFFLATLAYHVLVLLRFQYWASNFATSNDQDSTVQQVQIPEFVWILRARWQRLLGHDCSEARNPTSLLNEQESTEPASRGETSILPSVGRVSSTPNAPMEQEERLVEILRTSDEEIRSMTFSFDRNQVENEAFDITGRGVTLRHAPSLTMLLLATGVHSTVGNGILAPIDEDEAAVSNNIALVRRTIVSDKKLTDFEIVRRLGKGCFGEAHLCKDKDTKIQYAMKKLSKGNFSRLHRQERDTLRLCGIHENVASLFYAFEAASFFVLITEFCDLGSLSAYTRRHGTPGFTADLARTYGAHVLRGLGHMHGHSILHRDVKPDNVALKSGSGGHPVPKLIDFGLAKRANNRQSATIVGSFGYLAPELVRAMEVIGGAFRQSNTPYDGRIDIYSFGVVLFFLFVGSEATEDQYRTLWSHEQIQNMLVNENDILWGCDRYVKNFSKHRTSAGQILAMMRECGGVVAVQALTKTDPIERTKTVEEAFQLQLFDACSPGN